MLCCGNCRMSWTICRVASCLVGRTRAGLQLVLSRYKVSICFPRLRAGSFSMEGVYRKSPGRATQEVGERGGRPKDRRQASPALSTHRGNISPLLLLLTCHAGNFEEVSAQQRNCLQKSKCDRVLQLSTEELTHLPSPPWKYPGWGRLYECGSVTAVCRTNGLYLFSSSGRRERPEFLVQWVPLETRPWLLASSVQCQH